MLVFSLLWRLIWRSGFSAQNFTGQYEYDGNTLWIILNSDLRLSDGGITDRRSWIDLFSS
jgi:hypothetical protein